MALPFEQFPALSAIRDCRHVFTQRIPSIDVSHGKAAVLDRLDGAHSEIRKAVGVGDWPLFTAQQIHGNKIAVIDSPTGFQSRLPPLGRGEDEGDGVEPAGRKSILTLPLSLEKGQATPHVRARDSKILESTKRSEKHETEFPGCDGLITNERGIALGVYVADCCAVYIVDAKTPAIGLVHSGRKGTELGIVTNAIKQMIDHFGSDPAALIVQLSPCIRPPHYEVDFAAQIVRQCRALGVKQIHDSGICTACNLNRYYSYRVEKGKTGRMLALVVLNPTIAN